MVSCRNNSHLCRTACSSFRMGLVRGPVMSPSKAALAAFSLSLWRTTVNESQFKLKKMCHLFFLVLTNSKQFICSFIQMLFFLCTDDSFWTFCNQITDNYLGYKSGYISLIVKNPLQRKLCYWWLHLHFNLNSCSFSNDHLRWVSKVDLNA